MSEVHRFAAVCDWVGSTAPGHETYDRTHTVRCPPAAPALIVSSDAAFRGDPEQLNPEQLLLAAAATCQLLSFLAVAARARIDVRAYRDEAEADMPHDLRPIRITTIRLHPVVTVAPGADERRVHKLVALAHEQCFIANSLACDIDVQATVVSA